MRLTFGLTDKLSREDLKQILSQYYYQFNSVKDMVDILHHEEGLLHVLERRGDTLAGSALTLCLRQLEKDGKLVLRHCNREPLTKGNNLLGLIMESKSFRGYNLSYWQSHQNIFQYGELVESENADEMALEWWKRAFNDRRIFYLKHDANIKIFVDISFGMATDIVYQSLYRWLLQNYSVKIRGENAMILSWNNWNGWPESISQYYQGEGLEVVTDEVLLYTEESFICKLLDDGHAKMNGKLIAVYKRIDRTEELERDSTFPCN